MNTEKHIARHKMLHGHLDELIADFITHTKQLPSRTTLFEFIDWSHKQTENPDPDEDETVTA